MSSCEVRIDSMRNHLRGIHMPGVRFESQTGGGVVLGELVMFGRSIPVISPEQLEGRLRQIGCRESVIEEIVGNLFGYRVSTEAPIAMAEVLENFV